MRYIFATMVGGIMVSASFIAGAICMYGIMTEPHVSYVERHLSNDEPKEVEE